MPVLLLSALYICLFYIIIVRDFSNATAFVVKPVDTLVIAGDSTQLNCTYNVAPYLKTWYRGSTLVAAGKNIHDLDTGHYAVVVEGDVYNLRIHNTTQDIEGEYECADVTNRSRKAVASLYVIANVTKCSVKNDSTVIAGDDVSFNCGIELNDNAPGDLVWYREGREVSRASGHVNVWSTKLSKDDNGANFDCQLEHYTLPPSKWSELACEDQIIMDVQYTATVNMTVRPSNEVAEGSYVRITCSISDGYPEPYTLKLTLGSQELTGGDEAEIAYEVNAFGTDYIGFYRCLAVTMFFDGTEGFSEVGQEIKTKISSNTSNAGTVLFTVLLVTLVPVAVLIGILLSSVYWKRKLKDKDEYEHYKTMTRCVEGKSVYMKLGERTPFEISREFVYLRESLGEGAIGRFVKADAWNIAGREGVSNVVVKALKERPLDVDKVDFLKEIDLMKSIGTHPNIVSLLGCCTDYEPVYMILEFMEGGNLQEFLRNNRPDRGSAYINISNVNKTLTNTVLVTFAHQVSSGMEFLSSRECVHRNLSARNVLLDKDTVCKISDFGLALGVVDKPQYERKTKGKLSFRWMAMESIKDGIFTTKSDVWSFGIVLWEIVTMGNIPYRGLSEQEVTSSLSEGYRMPKPSHCEQELYSIIVSCWNEDLEKRPTFDELAATLQKMVDDEKIYIKMKDMD